MWQWNGSAWVQISGGGGGGSGAASGITFTPGGNISATDVQAAIIELDTEKAPLQVVHYDTAQTLTALEKAQAHSNIGPSALAIQTFTSSGTYTPTVGMTSCIIECIGGGAGGNGQAGTASYYVCGGGGGSGAYARKFATAATIGASQAVTIGAGGVGGPGTGTSAGSAGGDTSVGSICIAKGAPQSGNGYTPGTGGPTAGSVGDFTASGATGGFGMALLASSGGVAAGAGANSLLGAGAQQLSWGATTTGAAAIGRGGGGGGGMISGAGGVGGGAGAPGVVIITEYA